MPRRAEYEEKTIKPHDSAYRLRQPKHTKMRLVLSFPISFSEHHFRSSSVPLIFRSSPASARLVIDLQLSVSTRNTPAHLLPAPTAQERAGHVLLIAYPVASRMLPDLAHVAGDHTLSVVVTCPTGAVHEPLLDPALVALYAVVVNAWTDKRLYT